MKHTPPTIDAYDAWLEPYHQQLVEQQRAVHAKSAQLLGDASVEEFALGHRHFGLHRTTDNWILREWAPNATKLFMVGEMNAWRDDPAYEFTKQPHGEWALTLPKTALKHGMTYKLHVYWDGGDGYRLPAYVRYTVQDPQTSDFNAVVWSPAKTYLWKSSSPIFDKTQPLNLYEAHVGMSGEAQAIASYRDFANQVLPRIAKLGYNAVQLMAIQEHPYYGSFGYQVANFFAASSRFGTPDDLKYLVDTAHGLGLLVILDVVHSHATKNEAEGLSRFDGTLHQYFHRGDRGNHPAWDSRVFDYGKPEVAHFLLSNLRFWLDEYHFDGFRFDGVTSMLYTDHGLERAFTSYDDYFDGGVDLDSLTYLTVANQLIHSVKPDAITIAEEMSAFPGLAAPQKDGGVGFDYRLNMGAPDLWIKTLKESSDESWDLQHLFHELTSHRPEERTINYAESHDQALVGDKTLIFRLIDKDMYDHMHKDDTNLQVERGMALHKLIRLLTASTNAGGYLNFMGNEFGHPEWIDFPRLGNDWSYAYARRQWSLVDSPDLKYQYLNNFDAAMIALVQSLPAEPCDWLTVDQSKLLLSYKRGNYVFVFNFSPQTSYVNQPIPAPQGEYKLVLSSDATAFGGADRVDQTMSYHAGDDDRLLVYVPSRVALVFAVY